MEETFITRAIILARQPFRENDSRVIVYSFDRGRLDLVARGTSKMSSKLAAHIEPFNLVDLMIARGKKIDYICGCKSDNCFKNIKSDLGKIKAASEAVRTYYDFVKPGKSDKDFFDLLEEYLNILNDKNLEIDNELILNFFIHKFLILLGYSPELYDCVICKNKIKPDGNGINFSLGGVVCGSCGKGKINMIVSQDVIKILRLISSKNFSFLLRIGIDENLAVEIGAVIKGFYNMQK